jgi:ammonia channel protein AmtB
VQPAAQQAPRHTPQRIPRWLERTELFLRVLLRMYIGLAICYLPWSKMFWDQNPLFVQIPALGDFAASGAVRGIVSGLGILNLWIAFHDALHHRDG